MVEYVFLHVTPARMEWVVDNRSGDYQALLGAPEPVACGAAGLRNEDPSLAPPSPSRLAASLCGPARRVFSGSPDRDLPVLHFLLASFDCPDTVELHAFSDCLERETLDLYSCFPEAGRHCREFVQLLASELVDDTMSEWFGHRAAQGGDYSAAAMWSAWMSLRRRIDGMHLRMPPPRPRAVTTVRDRFC